MNLRCLYAPVDCRLKIHPPNAALNISAAKKYRLLKKTIPAFQSDQDAKAFVATDDLSQYDLSVAPLMRFERQAKDISVNLRLPGPLLDAVRDAAKQAGIPYQHFIRLALEQAVHPRRTIANFVPAVAGK